jgi:hypothetical protein
MANLNRASSLRPYKWHEQPFSQVLLGVRNGDNFLAVHALEHVVRSGDANAAPTLAFETTNDVAAIRQHGLVKLQ